jgi:hypothetical protein
VNVYILLRAWWIEYTVNIYNLTFFLESTFFDETDSGNEMKVLEPNPDDLFVVSSYPRISKYSYPSWTLGFILRFFVVGSVLLIFFVFCVVFVVVVLFIFVLCLMFVKGLPRKEQEKSSFPSKLNIKIFFQYFYIRNFDRMWWPSWIYFFKSLTICSIDMLFIIRWVVFQLNDKQWFIYL